LEKEEILEFLELKGIKEDKTLDIDEWKIIREILKDFEITKTNGIYVCTGTYFSDCDICYEDTNYYPRAVNFDSDIAEYRIYKDI